MSRGPGSVERMLRQIFEAAPDGAFSTDDLCKRIYGVEVVEKKHRVAVLRSARRVVPQLADLGWRVFRGDRHGGRLAVFHSMLSLPGYALARLKAYNDCGEDDGVLLAKIAPGGTCHRYVVPDGLWSLHVEKFRAEKAGDFAAAAAAAEKCEAIYSAFNGQTKQC